MSEESFFSVLRLNLLENFKPSAARKNIPKLTMIDIDAKMKPLYMFAPRKPNKEELEKSLQILVDKGYLTATATDGYVYWAITDSGVKILTQLLDGEEVDI